MTDIDQDQVFPIVKVAHQKKNFKGEDFVMCHENCEWLANIGDSIPVKFCLFGVFDGHGGEATASYLKCEMLNSVLHCLDNLVKNNLQELQVNQKDNPVTNFSLWKLYLPQAIVDAFKLCNEHCCTKFETSGSTATITFITLSYRCEKSINDTALVTIANVGDSHVYLDTSLEVLKLNDDHRIENNKAEQERIISEGSTIDRGIDRDDHSYPLRIWPGGLMMSRTIGDKDAVSASCIPAVKHLAIKIEQPNLLGGCRLVLASDGLWDAMKPKEACNAIRTKGAQAACSHLVHLCGKKGLTDDLSIIVVDLSAVAGFKTPFSPTQNVNRKRLSTISRYSAASSIAQDDELLMGSLWNALNLDEFPEHLIEWFNNDLKLFEKTLEEVRIPTPEKIHEEPVSITATDAVATEIANQEAYWRELTRQEEEWQVQTSRRHKHVDSTDDIKSQDASVVVSNGEKSNQKRRQNRREKGKSKINPPESDNKVRQEATASTVENKLTENNSKAKKKKKKQDDLFIGAIPDTVSSEDLKEYFGKFGTIRDASFKAKNKGFGFISFTDPSAVHKVMAIETHMVKGTQLTVQEANRKSQKPDKTKSSEVEREKDSEKARGKQKRNRNRNRRNGNKAGMTASNETADIQGASKDESKKKCFNCGQRGHVRSSCPEKQTA